MCGIVGKFSLDDRPIDSRLIARMADRLSHRGPDDSGHYVSGPIGLASRRLSIIDLATGKQPISNEDGTVWVVLNREIDNFIELRAELERRGHRFRTRTDTEVIVHLYEEEGPGLLDHLRGMFAFAVWDHRRRQLLLARDRLGERSEEHTSELQSHVNLVCRLLLEKKKKTTKTTAPEEQNALASETGMR